MCPYRQSVLPGRTSPVPPEWIGYICTSAGKESHVWERIEDPAAAEMHVPGNAGCDLSAHG